MKKLITYSVLIFLLLLGCQKPEDGILDTSKLTKVEMHDVSEEQENHIPITYKAPSVKVGLKALPFEMILPEHLPFDAEPFQPSVITDQNHDGKMVSAEFITNSKNKDNPILLKISAFNHEFLDVNQEAEKINLTNEITGYYYEKMLNFHTKGISYIIFYMNDTISKDQHKKEIVDLANQILE